MTDINILYNHLIKRGWCSIEHSTLDESILFLAKKIGCIHPDSNYNKIQYLQPKDKGHGIKNSFTYNFGLNEFPFHTDTAFWSNPVHYILMTSENESNCNTLLIDVNDFVSHLTNVQLSIFYNSIFTLKTPQGITFVSAFLHNGLTNIIRFDPNIMTPYNSKAKFIWKLLKEFISETKPIPIAWTGNNVLILDNWRILHKRSECKNEPNRILKRIYINNYELGKRYPT